MATAEGWRTFRNGSAFLLGGTIKIVSILSLRQSLLLGKFVEHILHRGERTSIVAFGVRRDVRILCRNAPPRRRTSHLPVDIVGR